MPTYHLGVAAQGWFGGIPRGHHVDTRDFSIDLLAKTVITSAGGQVRLTLTVWAILELLVHNRGALVPNVDCSVRYADPLIEPKRTFLRVYLAQLRRKLEPQPVRPRYLITEPGMGYRFQD